MASKPSARVVEGFFYKNKLIFLKYFPYLCVINLKN